MPVPSDLTTDRCLLPPRRVETHGADPGEGSEADEFDVRREVGGADGFLTEEVRAEVLLVAVREHRDDRGARAERVLHLERPEEVCARRDADGEAMVRELLPEMRDALFAGHTGNDGSAIAWGRELGARLADLGGYQGHGSWAIPQGTLISWGLMMEGGIQVNRLGERFHDETQGYSEAAVHVLAQPDGIAWNVFDDAILQFAQDFPDFLQAQSAGAVRHAANAQALAAR